MQSSLTKEQALSLFLEKSAEINVHVEKLKEICVATGEKLEGNCFYKHETFEPLKELIPKQLNFFWCGLQNPEKICEIGFNAGHSMLLLLLGAAAAAVPPKHVTIFDICEHSYTIPCFEYIKASFPQTEFELIKGDSVVKMKEYCENFQDQHLSYDLIHVDGGHQIYQANEDIYHSLLLLKKEGILIIDDIDNINVKLCLKKLLKLKQFNMFQIADTYTYPHAVLRGYPRILF